MKPRTLLLILPGILFVARPMSAQVVANQPTVVSSPLTDWRAFLQAPTERIDEPLAWMHADALRLNRIAQDFNELEFKNPTVSDDFRFRQAQVDSRRLALSLTSGSDSTLRATVARILVAEPAMDLAALGERTALYLDESRDIDSKWSRDVDFRRQAREEDYWRCFAAHPLAVPIGKRLTMRAEVEQNLDDLQQLEEKWVTHHPRHPWTKSVKGRRRRLSQIGVPFRVSLSAHNGGLIHLPAVNKRTVLLIVGTLQTPSTECIATVSEALGANGANDVSVVIAVMAGDSKSGPDVPNSLPFPATVAFLKRGWSSPLLREYDIRRLPAAFLMDREGNLVDVFQAENWNGDLASALDAFIRDEP